MINPKLQNFPQYKAASSAINNGHEIIPLHPVNDKGICMCFKGKDCKSPGKHPTTKNGLKDAFSETNKLDECFKSIYKKNSIPPNFGLITGQNNNNNNNNNTLLVVIDLDIKKDKGVDGHTSLKKMEEKYGKLPETVAVRTGGGGTHLLFIVYDNTINISGTTNLKPSNIGFGEKEETGVDILANGGYIVISSSTHSSGNSYEFMDCNNSDGFNPSNYAELPKNWVELLSKGNKKTKVKSSRKTKVQSNNSNFKKLSEFEKRKVADALSCVDSDDYNNWIKAGMVLIKYNERDIWDKWSQDSDKYDEKVQDKNWDGFNLDEGGVDIGTIYYLAQQNGWKPPYEHADIDKLPVSKEYQSIITNGHDDEYKVYDVIDKLLINGISDTKIVSLLVRNNFGNFIENDKKEAKSVVKESIKLIEDDLEKYTQMIDQILNDSNANADLFKQENIEALSFIIKYKREKNIYQGYKAKFRKLGITKDIESAIKEQNEVVESDKYQTQNSSSYFNKDGNMYYQQESSHGTALLKLSNFIAEITKEITKDDGISKTKYYEIKGVHESGSKFPLLQVDVNDFPTLKFINDWGYKAIKEAGRGVNDHLRAAIQLNSDDVEEITKFQHTGWVEIDGEYVYLHSGGGIGSNGNRTDISVDLGHDKSDISFKLEDPINDLREGVLKTIEVLEISPKNKMIGTGLMGHAFRAPLSLAKVVDHAVHLVGGTNSFKSTIAAIIQSFFGKEFDNRNLPGSFESTVVANEAKMFKYKDCIFVLDDFAPKGSAYDIARSHNGYDRLIRAMSNQSSRDKMNKDNELATGKYPRCTIISTGEDTPDGTSLRTRIIVIEIQGYKEKNGKEIAGDINKQVLSELTTYASSGGFSQVMSSYIQYISKNHDQIKKDVDLLFNKYRKKFNNGSYGRIIDNAVNIFIGISMFLKFAHHKDIITTEEAKNISSEHKKVLMDYLESNKALQASQDPVDRFIELIRSALSSGTAHICDYGGGVPLNGTASVLGWNMPNAFSTDNTQPMAKGQKIGWIRNDKIFLIPDVAFTLISETSRRQGKAFELTKSTIIKRLDERGVLIETQNRKNRGKQEKRTTMSKLIEGAYQNVIVISSETLGVVPKNSKTDYEEELDDSADDLIVNDKNCTTDADADAIH